MQWKQTVSEAIGGCSIDPRDGLHVKQPAYRLRACVCALLLPVGDISEALVIVAKPLCAYVCV